MDPKGEKIVARERAGKTESWGIGETYKVRQTQTWQMYGKGKRRLSLA